MAQPKSRTSRAGGFIIAVAVMAGAVIGIRCQQPSLGTVIGAAAGVLVTLALFLWDRRR